MGASSGIGRAIAETFASRGVKIGVGARRVADLEMLKAKYPGMIECEAIDVTVPEAKTGLARLIEKMGGMDIYIHVSGIGGANPNLVVEQETKVTDTNVTGFARMISAAYNYFRHTGRDGRIAAITSVAGTRGIGDMAAYSASKCFCSAYLVALSQLAHKHGTKVSFTDIQPGWIRTPLLRKEKIYPLEMTLEHAVPLMLLAIAERRKVAVIDWRWRVIKSLWKRIPNPVWNRMSEIGRASCRESG